jgi:hypothetical protein
MKRREPIRNLSVLPVAGVAIGVSLPVESAFATPVGATAPKRDFFKELGVTPKINAGGTMTFLSGSLMLPEVLEAINSTAHDFANMYEFTRAALSTRGRAKVVLCVVNGFFIEVIHRVKLRVCPLV